MNKLISLAFFVIIWSSSFSQVSKDTIIYFNKALPIPKTRCVFYAEDVISSDSIKINRKDLRILSYKFSCIGGGVDLFEIVENSCLLTEQIKKRILNSVTRSPNNPKGTKCFFEDVKIVDESGNVSTKAFIILIKKKH